MTSLLSSGGGPAGRDQAKSLGKEVLRVWQGDNSAVCTNQPVLSGEPPPPFQFFPSMRCTLEGPLRVSLCSPCGLQCCLTQDLSCPFQRSLTYMMITGCSTGICSGARLQRLPAHRGSSNAGCVVMELCCPCQRQYGRARSWLSDWPCPLSKSQGGRRGEVLWFSSIPDTVVIPSAR